MKTAAAEPAASPLSILLDAARALSQTGVRVSLSLTGGNATADALIAWAEGRGMPVASKRLKRAHHGQCLRWIIEQVLLGHGGDITAARDDEPVVDGGAE